MYPCPQCPIERFGIPDAVSQLTWELHGLLVTTAGGGMGGSPAWDFCFRLLAIEVPSPIAHEVMHRLSLLHRLQEEERERRKPLKPTPTKG